jgi:hypothetical protein
LSYGTRANTSKMNLELIEDLERKGSYTVRNGYACANEGIPLKHVRATYSAKSATNVSGECH